VDSLLYVLKSVHGLPFHSPQEGAREKDTQIHHLILLSGTNLAVYGVFLITSKVLDARRRGDATEAYGTIRRKEERSKATPQMMT
jgi:hypothetical protein